MHEIFLYRYTTLITRLDCHDLAMLSYDVLIMFVALIYVLRNVLNC